MALSAVYKEIAFKSGEQVNVWYLCQWVSIYQFLISWLFMPLTVRSVLVFERDVRVCLSVVFEREARVFPSFHFFMFQLRDSNQKSITHSSLVSLTNIITTRKSMLE